MEEGDKVGIFYNFIPTTQFSWASNYKNTLTKVKRGLPIDRDKFDTWFIVKWLISEVNSTLNSLTESFAGKKEEGDQTVSLLEKAFERINGGKDISECTKKKGTSTILNTQIAIFSESKDKAREHNNIRSLAQSFDSISGNNSLISKPLKKSFKPTDYIAEALQLWKMSVRKLAEQSGKAAEFSTGNPNGSTKRSSCYERRDANLTSSSNRRKF